MYLRLLLVLLYIMSCNNIVFSQQTFPVNGVEDQREDYYAFTNCKIYKSYNSFIDSCTLIIKKGNVVAVGQNITIPKDAIIIDLNYKYIYPGFIDIYSSYGMPEVKKGPRNFDDSDRSMASARSGAFAWNDALKTDFNAIENFIADPSKSKPYLEAGFCAVNTHKMDGISRGTSALISLSNQKENLLVIKDMAAHHLSFSKGTSLQAYPGSLMGSIALIRQTYLDSDWYQKIGIKEQYNLSLDAWNKVLKIPQIFDCGDKLNDLRAVKIAKEFNQNYIIKGGGNEYQLIEDINAEVKKIILPVNFPEAYDVEDPNLAERISLADLSHWELAPTNPRVLADAGVEIAFTTDGLDKISSFKLKILESVKNGLSKESVLKALTYNPASWLNVLDKTGTLEPGKIANFFISDLDYFDKNSKILQTWTNGKATVFNDLLPSIKQGSYKLKIQDKDLATLIIEKDGTKFKTFIQESDSLKITVNNTINQNLITLSFIPDKKAKKYIRLSGAIYNDNFIGVGIDENGKNVSWRADFINNTFTDKSNSKKDSSDLSLPNAKVFYPWVGFGWIQRPAQKDYLIKNATIWTNEKEGKLVETDLLIRNGKIDKIGKNINFPNAIQIDGSGKHLSAGIIDEHSHIAIQGGVNECTQANTAEVRIGDVIDCDDINIYRQLSGGVTAAQLLHGSCNPIGGQSAIIKLRWGFSPEKMKLENADGFIKFALGENVKSSSSRSNNRYPDTRMGVEQVYLDAFTRAKEYMTSKKDLSKSTNMRKDLELEALVEILSSSRFITCHSYVQSEINMLMHLAKSFGFKVNTFTHILEGYKVADKMKQHGVGASSFSDWWAYKYEVVDAIPYNGAILHDVGITTAFNSDDAEMARRLNQEAAKAIKYGGVSETEALKFVTLNPAKLLHIDQRTGSIKVGKDADIVLWSDNPLSMRAMAELTFVDGIKFFDRKEMETRKVLIDQERNRLIQKMLSLKKSGGKTEPFTSPKKILYHCDTVIEEETLDNH